jgi:glycyl-tRNA synthetase beta subunit
MKTTPLQNAIIISSIIGSIMSNYDPALAADRKKPINEIRRRIKKFMFTRSRSSVKEFYKAIAVANAVLKNAVNHFADKNIQIDAVSTVIRLYDLYADAMSRYANIHEKQMERYANGAYSGDIELTSYEVSDYIIDQLSEVTGVKRQKLNLLQRVKNENKVA